MKIEFVISATIGGSCRRSNLACLVDSMVVGLSDLPTGLPWRVMDVLEFTVWAIGRAYIYIWKISI